MTKIEWTILAIILILIVAFSIPPFLDLRRVEQADIDVETISNAIKKFHKHTGKYPEKLTDLITEPKIDGWRYPYLDEIPKTPWKTDYQIFNDRYKIHVGISDRIPKKYRIGEIAEISRVYADDQDAEKFWW